jgi:circadian clock protein KaiC
VFPRLVAAGQSTSFRHESVSSGVTEIDELLGGGIDRGTGTLIMGPAGAGKSALATQYAVSTAERGESVVWFIFDEGMATLLTRSAGMGMDIAPHVESGRIKVQPVDPAELSPGEFAKQICDAVAAGANMVILDSLNGYLQAMSEEQFVAMQLHEVLTFLRQKGAILIMVMAQQGFLGPTVAPIDVSYLADTVILLRYFEAEGRVRKAISVVKKRSGPHEDTIREVILTGRGFSVGPPLQQFRGVLSGTPTFDGKK